MKIFECFKDVKLFYLNFLIFKKIFWGEGIDKNVNGEVLWFYFCIDFYCFLFKGMYIYNLNVKYDRKRDLR